MKIWKKIILMFLGLTLLTGGAVAAYVGTIYRSSQKVSQKTFNDLGRDTSVSNQVIQATQPLTILLMGVDMDEATRGGDWEGGRSDSMILVTVNPQTQKTVMMSLTRDIMVEIASPEGESTGTVEKLNHSYAYGQAPMAIATIEKMMDVKIDKYVQINMDGLMQLVDVLGGIEVENTLGFDISIEAQEPAYTAVIPPGKQFINGSQALVYSRMRYDDPEGDIGRQKRQREVIQAILSKLLQLDGFTKYEGILNTVSENMQTDVDITPATISSLLGYKEAVKTIETYQLSGDGQMIDELYYQIPTSQHLLEMQNILKRSLGLEEKTELTTNVQVLEKLFGYSNPITVIDAFTGERLEGTGYIAEVGETTEFSDTATGEEQ